MKKHLIINCLLVWSFLSCDNKTGEADSNRALGSNTCYIGIIGQDSIYLQLNMRDSQVEGDLKYNFYEKDDTQGVLEGEFLGDTLFANYRFISEGIESEREVAFLRNGDSLQEGYGEMEEKDGKMVFVSRNSLNYGQSFLLGETECP